MPLTRILTLLLVALALLSGRWTASEAPQEPSPPPLSLQEILAATDPDREVRRPALQDLVQQWDLSYLPILLEVLYLTDLDRRVKNQIWDALEKATRQDLPPNPFHWFKWLWEQEYEPHPDYARFKGDYYAPLDERFRRWFYAGVKRSIRLDEVLWGGVKVDGIPPLEHPSFISADEADYLEPDNIVFGIFLNGDARAYPKRILAWHELFNDRVGEVDVTCAYCTLCGSAVLYAQKTRDRTFDFGTSGFLYRSNKLMYDRQTHSLWSALEGVPVSGELVGSGLELRRLPLVTTTWEAWTKRHPETRVLSLDTGFDRDYGEGVAYRDYFATDDLMFPVPHDDDRLRNKQEVLALRSDDDTVAFSVSFLEKNPLYEDDFDGRRVIILTDRSGASRVYEKDSVLLVRWDRDSEAVDDHGQVWEVTEEALVGPDGRLGRVPAHRAFWFGWVAQFPESRLVH